MNLYSHPVIDLQPVYDLLVAVKTEPPGPTREFMLYKLRESERRFREAARYLKANLDEMGDDR